MPAAEVRPAGASQYSTGGVSFLRSGPMSGPVRYLANWSFACAKPYTCLPLLRLYVSFCAAAKNSSYVQLPSLGGVTPASLKRSRLMYSNHGTIQSGYATTLPLYVVA